MTVSPGPLDDSMGRRLRDLRISVTDRCNLRCRYCMPREVFGAEHAFLNRDEILSFEEICRVVRLASTFGVDKVRLTGGEPLLRRDFHTLVGMLSQFPDIDLALTTNGILLSSQSPALAAAGLTRITVSLDSLDEAVFTAMTDGQGRVSEVLAGIEAARAAGLGPIKVNAVVRKGVNDHTAEDLALHFKGSGVIVRFIEYMDVGESNHWQRSEVVPSAELAARIHRRLPLEPIAPNYRGEVARRYRYQDGSGEIGFISSVTQPFCGDCTRARLSSEGQLYTCLFATRGTDLRGPMRQGASDDEIAALMASTWKGREDRYSELRGAVSGPRDRIEMSYIGG